MLVFRTCMATMTHRCTFALDGSTTARIRRLAALWEVSQAEVIRRVVAAAETPEIPTDPADRLRRLHRSGEGLHETPARDYLAEVQSDRKNWRTK